MTDTTSPGDQRHIPDRRSPEGRRVGDQELQRSHAAIHELLAQGQARMDAQDMAIRENTTMTAKALTVAQQTKDDTQAIVETFQDMKGAFKVLEGLGKLARPVGYLVMLGSALVGLVTAIKTGAWWGK